MPDRTLKNSYYMLSRHFGVRAQLARRLDAAGTKDYLQGTQTATHDTPIKITVVLLPTNYFVQERLRDKMGDVKIGDVEFLIEGKLGVELNDNIIHFNKTYRIVYLDTYSTDAVYGLMRNVQDES